VAHEPGREDADRQHDQEGTVVRQSVSLPAWMSGDRVAALSVSREVYSRKVVLAAAYKLSDRCAILVDVVEPDRWVLYLVAQPGGDAKPLLSILISELGDQSLREYLEAEFGPVRTLIVAQAFSEGNLLDPRRDDGDHSLEPRRTGERR
jgi:His-Xaa-Ser system protein HxsD